MNETSILSLNKDIHPAVNLRDNSNITTNQSEPKPLVEPPKGELMPSDVQKSNDVKEIRQLEDKS